MVSESSIFSEALRPLVRPNEPLAPYCWLRIGGNARYFAEPENLEQLSALCREAHNAGLLVRILGGGSNILVRKTGVDGLVIKLTGSLTQVETRKNCLIAGGGADLGQAVTAAAAAGLAGLEHMAGIPGSIGGAIVTNSGVSNDDIGSHVKMVRAVGRDGSVHELERQALHFGFRRSNLEDLVVAEVEMELEMGDAKDITRKLQAAWIVKKTEQPPTGASVAQAFLDPSGWRIGEVLEAAGMRTASEGEAAMSSQFPGFLVVNDDTNAEEVLALTSRISRAVEVQSGIQLQSRLVIW